MTALSSRVGKNNKVQVHLYVLLARWSAAIAGTFRALSNSGSERKLSLVSILLIAIVIYKLIVSFFLKPDSLLVAAGGVPYFLLLFLGTGFALYNAIQNTLKGRPFWLLLAFGYGLWTLNQGIFLYYQFGPHIEVPDNSMADPVLFLHVALFLAAAATLPHQVSARNPYGAILNSALMVIFWEFLYFYFVFPYQLSANAAGYALRFDILYLIENWALILIAGYLSVRALPPWKSICLHLLGASALYSLSSAVANLAIDSGGYANGKLYGLGLTIAVCWFVWIPVGARKLEGTEVNVPSKVGRPSSQVSLWAMVAVVLISIPVVWELVRISGATGVPTFRLLVAVSAIVCLAMAAFLKEHLANKELAFDYGSTNDRLQWEIVRGISERKKAEQMLQESENRFRLIANTAPVLIWMSGPDKECTFCNQGWLQFTGRSLEEELGDGWASSVHPDDRERCLTAYARAFDARANCQLEYRLRRFDGEYRWMFDFGVPRFEADGTFRGYVGSCLDISERKQSEESLHSLTGRLINAQEEERTRIARELHDDFTQRLALLGIGLGQLWKRLPNSDLEERASVKEMLETIREMSSDMHALSHQLHSSKLEHVGLVPAISGLCKEIQEKHKIALDFEEIFGTLPIPKDVAFCLFRVAQEALANVVKHSKSERARIELRGSAERVTLRILDYGKGFEPALQNPRAGIGMIGMTERLRLVKGTLSVKSEPNRGTEIFAEIPLAVTDVAARANAQFAGR